MTSKSREVTDNTPPLSLGESTEAKAQPSKPLASSDNTPPSTPTLKKQSAPMLSTAKSVSEKSRQHAAILKVVLLRLEKAGLVRRFEVLSKTGELAEIQIVFDNSLWTKELDLKVLSNAV